MRNARAVNRPLLFPRDFLASMDTRAASPKVRSPGFPDANCWPTAGHSSANQVTQRKREGVKSNKTLEDA
jgi:hypothetical protein